MSRQREFGQFDQGAGTAAAKRGKKAKAKAKPASRERAERGGSKHSSTGGVDMAGVRHAMGRGREKKG